MMMFGSSRRRKDEEDTPALDYSIYDHQAETKKLESTRAAGGCFLFLGIGLSVILFGLALYFPATWLAIAVFGIPILLVICPIIGIVLYLKTI